MKRVQACMTTRPVEVSGFAVQIRPEVGYKSTYTATPEKLRVDKISAVPLSCVIIRSSVKVL